MSFQNAINSAAGNLNSVITLEIPGDSKLPEMIVTADIKNLFFDFWRSFKGRVF